MNLFKVGQDGIAKCTMATLAITEFRAIYERDKSVIKRRAWLELSAIFFIGSMSSDNPYRGFPREHRIEEINNEVFKGEAALDINDSLIVSGIKKMIILDKMSLAKDALRTAINGTHRLRDYINNVDLNERDENNKPIHDPKKYQDILRNNSGVAKALIELEKEILVEEAGMDNKVRGGAEDEFNI